MQQKDFFEEPMFESSLLQLNAGGQNSSTNNIAATVTVDASVTLDVIFHLWTNSRVWFTTQCSGCAG